MSNVFIHFKLGESGKSWGIEYLSVGEWPIVKFWHVVTFCKWRAMDINWRNPGSDGPINSVTYEINDHPNQEWKLIGIGIRMKE